MEGKETGKKMGGEDRRKWKRKTHLYTKSRNACGVFLLAPGHVKQPVEHRTGEFLQGFLAGGKRNALAYGHDLNKVVKEN